MSSDANSDDDRSSKQHVTASSAGVMIPVPSLPELSLSDRHDLLPDNAGVISPNLDGESSSHLTIGETFSYENSSNDNQKPIARRVRKIAVPLQFYNPEDDGQPPYKSGEDSPTTDDDMFMKLPDVFFSPPGTPSINHSRSVSTPIHFLHTSSRSAYSARKTSVPLPLHIPEDREASCFSSSCSLLGSPPAIFISCPRYNAQVC